MKANELMIGDWVMQDDNLQQNRTCQITGIYDNVVVDVTGEKVPLHESHIKPIPLTPEILEKNGFTRKLEADGLHYRFTLIYEHTMFSLLYVRSVFLWLNPLDFKYVHQLQHALRLCGIEKNIEL